MSVRSVSSVPVPRPVRRSAGLVAALVVVAASVLFSGASAAAQPPEGTSSEGSGAPQPALNTFIDPALLESVQQSIVGLVVIWEEPADPFATGAVPEQAPVDEFPALTICTGWFDSPTTIVTAGHCVDPEEGRRVLDNRMEIPLDPGTGQPLPVPQVRPEPERTVWAFQPRELEGAVLTAPVIVRVDSFRPADEGDTAKLEMYGMPPAKPLPVAPAGPRLGETVTSIGFPGLNIEQTDGVDVRGLVTGGKTPAEVLQDSRLQPVNTSGTITATQYRNGVAVHQINADLAEGISGGPTINSRGEVYGVNSEMTVPFLGQNFNVITDTGMLREFLGLPPVQPDAAATSAASRLTGGGSFFDGAAVGWTVLLSALGGALVGGLVTWAFTRSRAGSRSASSPAEPAEAMTTRNGEAETSPSELSAR